MKKVVSLLLVTFLMMSMAACGQTPASTSTTANSTSTATDGEQKVITWMTVRASWPAMEAVVEAYMQENPNIKVEFQSISDRSTYNQKLKILAANNELPDLFDSEGDSALAEIASTGVLADIDELYDELGYDGASYIQKNYARLSDGKLYSLAWENNVEYIWYHKDLFAQAGVEAAPETFDEFLDVCQKLKDAGIPAVSTWPGWALQRWIAFIPYRLEGNDYIENLKVGKASMGDATGLKAAEFFQTMGENYFQPGWATSDYTTALELFLSGETAMYYTGTWQFDSFLDDNRELKEDYDFFYMPTLDGAINGKTAMWSHAGTGTSVNKNKLDDQLKDFIKYVLENFTAGIDFSGDNLSSFDQRVKQDMDNMTDYGYCWDVRLDAASNEVMQKEIVNLGMGAINPQEFADRVDAAIKENVS